MKTGFTYQLSNSFTVFQRNTADLNLELICISPFLLSFTVFRTSQNLDINATLEAVLGHYEFSSRFPTTHIYNFFYLHLNYTIILF